MGHPHRQEGVLGSFAAPLAATMAAALSPAGLGEGERGRPPPQQLHMSRHMEVKIIPGGDKVMRSRAQSSSGSDDDRGRRSPPLNYKMDEAAAVLTPTTCASVTSLDDSRSPILPVRVDLVGLGYDPKHPGASSSSSSTSFSPLSPSPKHGATADSAASTLILQGLSATLHSGELVGVMGPSGSGKSTLLRLVHGDHRYLRGMRGHVLVNGTPVQSHSMHRAWRQLCSLVPQEDVLLGSFTVHETLLFSAQLRLPPQRTRTAKESVVEAILADLGMRECAHVRVQEISGGQRRRVSVGLELIVNPSVLILDEPTSGLDSKTAEDICVLLKALSKPGRLVVCSIHQPSFNIFSSFSRLCFLVKGKLAYAGSFRRVMPYFEALGYVVPTFENPSDFYMRAMQVDGAALTAAWTESSNEQQGGTPSEKEAVAPWDPQGKWLLRPEAKSRRAQATACGWHQYCVLLRRFLADSYKDKGKMLSSFVMEGTIGLLIGLVWYNQDVRDSGSAFAIAGVFIMLTTIAIFDNCLSVGLKFPLTRALHFREFSNGYYRLGPYYLASVTSSLLLSCTYQLVQALLVFFLVSLDFTPKKFLCYLLVLALAAGMGAFLGFIVGTHTSDLKRTHEILTPILMPLLIFSGYMLPLPQLPSYLRFLYYSSFYQYTFSSLMILHFTGLDFDECTFHNPFCIRHGEDYLKIMGLAPDMLVRNLLICAGFLAFLILVGYLSLRRVSL